MKKLTSIAFGVLVIGFLIAFSADTFNRGENLIRNSGFEADEISKPPAEWELLSGG